LSQTYLIALGSNMRVPGIGSPRRVLAAALELLEAYGLSILAAAPALDSAPIGPSTRRYANSAAVIETALLPRELLRVLQVIEHEFGRNRDQRRGQRWRARALDLDIILWSGGVWISPRLTIPHREMRERDFVLGPACKVAGEWRDPVTGLTLGHLHARLMRRNRGG
jgi:2-amino-4-hydroxy-6-hydroxymethyldihydropteridine diphosphokinase